MNGSHIGLFVSLIGFNFLDFGLTYYGIKRGLCKEANPMMKMLIGMGWRRAFAFKMTWSMLIGIYFMVSGNITGLIIANLMFIGICIWNYTLMKRRLRKLREQKARESRVSEDMVNKLTAARVVSVERIH